jgi:dTDP-4-amino-4,6-dideoxygalactose transaminase
LSFNGNKTITTGGGGAILMNDSALYRRAKHITTTAKLAHAWDYTHDEVGYNYRMPNINAALGCAQLEQLPRLVEAKRDLYKRYEAAFAGIDGLRLRKEPADCVSNYWLQALGLSPRDEGRFEGLLGALNQAGFMSRPAWTLMHKLKPYRDCPRMELTQSESLARRLVNFPSSSFLSQQSRS